MDELRARALELLNYNPETGIFTRRFSRGGYPAGSVAGALCNGYIKIFIDGKSHSAHRLAFLVIHGHMPDELDHINGDPSDNRIANLREATRRENQRNKGRYSNNQSGYKGASWHKSNGRWQANARDSSGKKKHLGYFNTPEAASAAYEAYAMKLHGDFFRQNPSAAI